MIFRQEDSPSARQADLTPLINIVFLMLIFFMLAGSLTGDDGVQTARVESVSRADERLLIVSVDKDGQLLVEGLVLEQGDLVDRLRRHREQGGEVGLRPDARLLAGRLVEVAGLLRQTGFTEVTLITRAP